MKILGKNKNYLGLSKKYSSIENSKIVIVSAPLEKTVSYGKGTRFGPREIIKSSHFVEFYDEELKKELCFQLGICTLEELTLNKLTQIKALRKIEHTVSKLINMDKFVVVLGGEHSLSTSVINAYNSKYKNISILQIDAHSDLRNSYEGSKYSHASVMARAAEIGVKIIQVGIRAQCAEEIDLALKSNVTTFYARDIRRNKYGKKWQAAIVENLNENVYITFDVDGFDPSVIPATGTPEPGGLFWDETMELLKMTGRQKSIIGFDVVELAPSEYHTASNFIAAKLVYKMLNYAFQ